MKRINTLLYIIGVVCFIIAGYIIYDSFFVNNEENVNFNEEEELVLVNDKLSEVGSSLGWLIIVDAIDNQDTNGNYNITFNKDLLEDYSNRQLFIMEYILNYSNYDAFIVLDMNGNVIDDIPTSEMTMAYINYDDFNSYYKELFGEDFDLDKANKGNISYDDNYVFYDNRKTDTNGVYVSMIQATSVEYKGDEYVCNVTVTYSTDASELVGINSDIAVLKYTRDIDNNINFKSFTLKDR